MARPSIVQKEFSEQQLFHEWSVLVPKDTYSAFINVDSAKNIAEHVDQRVLSLLNSPDGGYLYFGVETSGKVRGVRLSEKEMNLIEETLRHSLGGIKPMVSCDTCKLNYIPVRLFGEPTQNETDRFVLEIRVVPPRGLEIFTRDGLAHRMIASGDIETTTSPETMVAWAKDRMKQWEAPGLRSEVKNLQDIVTECMNATKRFTYSKGKLSSLKT